MNLLDLPYEHRNWSIGKDFEVIRQFNPLGRVPTLVLSDGEALIESAAILDFLDECAGPDRALLPAAGRERREALHFMALATGAAEKGVLQIYESAFRPQDKRHEPWLERCRTQMLAALTELDRLAQARAGEWLIGNRLTQADVSAGCVFTFLSEALIGDHAAAAYPGLSALAERCEALPEFRAAKAQFSAPNRTQEDPAEFRARAEG